MRRRKRTWCQEIQERRIAPHRYLGFRGIGHSDKNDRKDERGNLHGVG